MSFTYVASPYTHPSPEIVEARFRAVEEIVAGLLRKEVYAYSPIVHCHELAKRYELPTSFSFWAEYNYAMLDKASMLIVVKLPGWETSVGVTAELARAASLGIPVQYIEPE